MLGAVIFDLDGVIVDSHPAHRRAWKVFFQSLGKNVSDEELLFVLEGQKREDILRHFLGDLSEQQVKYYGARKEALFKDCTLELKTMPGVMSFLDQLEAGGVSIALASSASRARVEYILERLQLVRRFGVVVTGDDVARGKPDPTVFRAAARRLKVNPENVLVCEDAVCGVFAAKAAGMKCLAIAADGRGLLLENAGADRVLPDFAAADLEDLRTLFLEEARK